MLVFDGLGGRRTITVNRGNDVVVDNFGVFGTVSPPSAALSAELDTLKFVGSGLAASNMLMRQDGADVVITFEGIGDTQVRLRNVALQDLENVAGILSGSGNFLFDGQTRITNSVDVIDATANPAVVLSSGTTTFLNDLNNVIAGSSSADVINGQGGNDTIDGLSGNDILRGGDGNDVLKGGSGSDRLMGDDGNDSLEGGSGNDVLRGGAGNDLLTGGSGSDNMDGGAGSDDYRVGGTGDGTDTFNDTGSSGDLDRILATAINTRITLASGFGPGSGIEEITANGFAGVSIGGGSGTDSFDFSATTLTGITRIDAGSGNDTVTGSGGADRLEGGSGNDVLKGGEGGDSLVGGTGNDNLDGGGGTDSAVFAGARAGYQITTVGDTTTVIDLLPFTSGNDGTDTITNVERLVFSDQVVILGGAVNQAPSAVNLINTTAALNETTDTTAGVKVADITVVDDGLGTNTLGLTGADASSFEIVGSELRLKAGVLNFEAKQSYSVQVTVNDATVGGDPDATSTLFTVNVTDVNETPVAPADFAANAEEDVNDTAVLATVTGTDPDVGGGNDALNTFENLSYAIQADASGKFEIDAATGEISLKAGETLDAETASSHVLTVRVSDGPGLFDDVDVTINLTDVNEAPTAVGFANTTTAIDENTDTSAGIKVADIIVTDDALGLNSLALIGADAALFEIVGTELRLKAGVLDFETKESYSVQVTADDVTVGGTPDATSALFTVNVNDLQGEPAPTINLNALDGINGFTVVGNLHNDGLGNGVSAAGDFNNDGFADILLGANGVSTTALRQGAAYVVFGGAAAPSATVLVSSLTGPNGFRLLGVAAGDVAGDGLGAVGDFNGDGIADALIGAHRALTDQPETGAAYLVFGASGGFSASTSLSALDGTNGVRFEGIAPGDQAGVRVSTAGDINADGISDLIIGAEKAEGEELLAGAAYVVFGTTSAQPPTFGLEGLDGATGFRINGISNRDFTATTVSGGGDFNGDGIDDVIVAAPGLDVGSEPAGGAFVVFGRSAAFDPAVNLSELSASTGVRLEAEGILITSVAFAGDVNGDGIGDYVLGSPFPNSGAGVAFVVFGEAAGLDTSINLLALDGTNGFRVDSVPGDGLGFLVSGAGDVNGDGYDDVILGAPGSVDPGGIEASAYVILGRQAFDAEFNVQSIDSSDGIRLVGGQAGDRVATAGDVNGDGYDDLLLGASNAPFNGSNPGAAYLVYGGDFNGAVTHQGSNAGETLVGTIEAETFVLGQGDDTAVGNGGADAFQGATGNDTIIVGSDLPFDVDGGSGIDTVNLDALGPSIDLSGLASTIFTNLEIFDLSGTSANTLTLDRDAVFHMAGPNGANFGVSTVLIEGDLGDAAFLFGDWIAGATVSDPFNQIGTFVRYTNGAATVLVDVDVDVNDAPTAVGFANTTTAIDESTDTSAGIKVADIVVTDDALGLNSLALIGTDAALFDIVGTELRLKAGVLDFETKESYSVQVTADDVTVGGTPDAVSTTFTVQVNNIAVESVLNINVETLNGVTGSWLFGFSENDDFGDAIDGAGDVNGDGLSDVLVGAPRSERSLTNTGTGYLYFGRVQLGPFSPAQALDPPREDGFQLFGDLDFGNAGNDVAGAGDFNADGYADMLIGAPRAAGHGIAYLVLGVPGIPPASTHLSTLDGANGVAFEEVEISGNAGIDVSAAGDINGDGIDDILIGAPGATNGGQFFGTSYVVFGTTASQPPVMSLADIDGANGFRIGGAALTSGTESGTCDFNGDGIADLVVASHVLDGVVITDVGAFVIYGKSGGFSAFVDLTNLASADGIGMFVTASSSVSIAAAGDVNGDGFDDVIIGARDVADGGAGGAFVVFGRPIDENSSIDLLTLDGINGFRVKGVPAEAVGASVSGAGDINGDGFDDIIVSVPGRANSGFGEVAAFVIYGRPSFDAEFDPTLLDRGNGIRFTEGMGSARVTGLGDINGDGYDDVAIGAPGSDFGGPFSRHTGSAFVVNGGNFRNETTHAGTANNDNLVGDAARNIMVGGLGDDSIVGSGGADVINGGAGNDTIEVSDLEFFRIDGGLGSDTVRLLTSSAIDFGNIDGDSATSDRGRMSGIDVIDVTNGQANALTLALADVLDLDANNIDALGTTIDNVLAIKGEAGDTLALIDPGADSWAASGATFDHAGVTYQLYTAGPTDAIKVAVDTEILVTPS